MGLFSRSSDSSRASRPTISELADAMTTDSGPDPVEFGRAIAALIGDAKPKPPTYHRSAIPDGDEED
ncbi:hypothetical protein BX265_2321 [Streptomyces sp. TLI_235]|nr:hypothetical protein [Streptomyces sp. TLI_235]PBC77570.1 hypothetical protein BX265_2321 [Streptomyces sp. TLI_235]